MLRDVKGGLMELCVNQENGGQQWDFSGGQRRRQSVMGASRERKDRIRSEKERQNTDTSLVWGKIGFLI